MDSKSSGLIGVETDKVLHAVWNSTKDNRMQEELVGTLKANGTLREQLYIARIAKATQQQISTFTLKKEFYV